ncbi:DUF3422 family protein [Acidiphilium sp.]|uniref:DUF3422 family protein n=1 Tax=Acidiphilium sp. TaxID=527 RepID=UPI003CFFCB9D
MIRPANHPQRVDLNNEAHARPPQELTAPMRISYLALFSDASMRDAQRRHVSELAAACGVAPPGPTAIHFTADMGRFRLKWELHSEFVRYKFIIAGTGDDPFADPPIQLAPPDWVASMVGQIMVATHVALLPFDSHLTDYDEISNRWFAGNPLVGSNIASGAAVALMDFRIREDGFNRLLILDRSLRPRQAGRAVQRLLEIDTYRLMAQLTLPIARQLGGLLDRFERELVAITNALAGTQPISEPDLLDRLTRLAAEIEHAESQNHYRFSAARAYYLLVQRRIRELREERLPAIQTLHEFTELRLAPAMNTCMAAAERQDSLAERVTRATQLLSTRVDITRERQEMAVLESMNQRADLQLRLQQTVEGLSVAAITYYIAGLIGYLAHGVRAMGEPINPGLVVGASIPVVLVLVALGIRRIHHMVHRQAAQHDSAA